jgi:hypothetical protein
MLIMKLKNVFKKILKSENGGIGQIIAMVVSIVLVLGLIAYAILGQVAGTKATADKAGVDQNKINLMLQDSTVVTAETVKYQMNNHPTTLAVAVQDTVGTAIALSTSISDSALFRITSKTNDANGVMTSITYKQIDLTK